MPVDPTIRCGHHRSQAVEALLLAAGVPVALAGHLAGRRLAEGAWAWPDPADPAGGQAWLLTVAAFPLAAAVHLVRPWMQHAGRRIAATMRSATRRRWGRGRTHREFARAYRTAGLACALAAALLICALLAAFGIEPIDQSVAVIGALAVAMFARLALRVFAGLRFRPLVCLGACFALWAGAGWLGVV